MFTRQEIALQIESSITKDTRNDGSKFEYFDYNKLPAEWESLIQDACYEIHNGSSPNDWVYSVICDIVRDIAYDGELTEDYGDLGVEPRELIYRWEYFKVMQSLDIDFNLKLEGSIDDYLISVYYEWCYDTISIVWNVINDIYNGQDDIEADDDNEDSQG